jgi:ketosteroid isomerase-like protein/dienelactone hydrolase
MNTARLAIPALAPSGSLAAAPAFTVERVTFTSSGETLAGSFYRPTSAAETARLPAVVVTGAWMTVKEQMPANYAAALAERGFAALAFDFRGWGESAGARRQFEDPAAKIADIRAAFAYLATRPDVAADRLGGLGICASSGYLVHAAASDPTIRSVALAAPWLHDREIVEKIYGGAASVEALLAAGDAAEAAYRSTGRQTFLPAASLTDKSAVMFGAPYYTETDRGLIPAWRNAVDSAFWRGWLTFDAMTAAPRLTQPLLLVESDAAALPQGVRKFFGAVTAPKHELWLDGLTQFNFYDRPAPIARATDAIAAHFVRTLPAATAADRTDQSLSGIREFFAALEAMDIPRFLAVWADDGVQEMPYAPGAFARRLDGKAAIERQYGPLPAAFDGMKFTLHRLEATERPGTVFAEFQGSIALKNGGRYDNTYFGLFEFNSEGKLARYVEYFDPYTLINGFPGAAEAALPDSARIERLVNQLARSADARDWSALRAVFADEVEVDYTSVAGGQPGRLAADALVAGWEKGLGAYAQTKHNFSDLVVKVSGDRATATFTGQATHVKTDGTRWNCGGDYTYAFARTAAGWRATAATFEMRWELGRR